MSAKQSPLKRRPPPGLMPKSGVSYRRSRHLVSYWVGEDLVFRNYATGADVTATPLASELLHFFDRWRSANDLFSEMRQFSRPSLRQVLATLVKHSLLERSDRPQSPAEKAMKSWSSWNPEAGFLHFSTKDVAYEPDEAKVDRFLRWRLRTSPLPPRVKRYPGNFSLPLPEPVPNGEFFKVLLARRTWRRFSKRVLELPALSALLGLTFGVQQCLDLGKLGTVSLKTSPSGGARHPIEAYVLARRTEGIAPGLYHYQADAHRLSLLKRGATSRNIVRYLAGQTWFGHASALVLMTAAFARTEWDYPYARSYRAVLLEAGHVCQTFCLVATALGLAPFCTDALADSLIERDLGIDGVTESVLYAAGVGTRPPGVEWAPAPESEVEPRRFSPRREPVGIR